MKGNEEEDKKKLEMVKIFFFFLITRQFIAVCDRRFASVRLAAVPPQGAAVSTGLPSCRRRWRAWAERA